MQSYQHGVPSWVDLGTPDLTAATAFYSGLFGWQVQAGPPESGGYAIAELRGKPVAGLGPQMNPGPPFWATYVNVDSADEVIGRVADAGGQVIMPPMDVMDAGRMAILADPLGAVISVWQPANHAGAGLVNEPGTYGWSELITTDIGTVQGLLRERLRLGRPHRRRRPANRLHRVAGRWPFGGRHDAQAADDAGRSAAQLGRLLRRHRRRCRG